MDRLLPEIEAILFTATEPVSKEKIIKEFGIERSLLHQIIEYLKEKYASHESGIQLVEIANGYQILTKPQYKEIIEKFYGSKRISKLSIPALETLAIIAYKQPVIRHEIEDIRGVNCDGVIKTLLDRELIVRKGQADLPGKPSLYRTTKKFLEYFKLTSLKELPSIDELTSNIEQEELFDKDENDNENK